MSKLPLHLKNSNFNKKIKSKIKNLLQIVRDTVFYKGVDNYFFCTGGLTVVGWFPVAISALFSTLWSVVVFDIFIPPFPREYYLWNSRTISSGFSQR